MKSVIAFFALFVVLIPTSLAEDDHPRPFDENYDAMSVVDEAMTMAMAENKRLLLVLGANWCHDSRGLAHHFEDPELARLLADNYVLRFIDVHWFTENRSVMNRFGIPTVYGTPTVFIIDPVDETLLNRQERSRWTSAASAPIEEVRAYFSRWANPSSDIDLIETSLIFQSMMIEIELFEDEEGVRMASAFDDIARWRAMESDDRPNNFGDLAIEADEWRRQLPRHVSALREQARNMVETALAEIVGDDSITNETIAILDNSDPDLGLAFERHDSETW